ncbi:MAG TPA: SAM-dependent methyltransferase [Dehalococcoidia bacterium]|nr:SAM-dependent methyltransferase [Dehalococcoidia bacterium]
MSDSPTPQQPAAPQPADDFALASGSTPLARVIGDEIAAADGRITFERFMALALGHPEHGYYSREDVAWGAQGDYETSPEVHSIFGYLWARQIAECWHRLGEPDPFTVIEPGAGSGRFAVDIHTWLRERAPDCAAATRAVLLDGSPQRLAGQRRTLQAAGLTAEYALVEDWLNRESVAAGVVISNEFFDALPVHLVERRDGTLHEWYVTAEAEGGLALELGPASTPQLDRTFEALGLQPGDGSRAEVSLAAPEVMARLSSQLDRGYLLTIDYGKEAADLYASWRRMGTLMAFQNHSPQPDPLASPGLLDLTAHVDFTTLAAAADGYESAPTVSQAEALVALGVSDALDTSRERASADVAQFATDRRAVETLTDLAGLGRIRVLVQAKDAPLDGLLCLRPLGG